MKNSELYDALSKIDDKYVENAENLRKNTLSETKPGPRNVRGRINTRAMTAIAAAVIAAVFVMSAVAVLTTSIRRKNAASSPDATGEPIVVRPPVITGDNRDLVLAALADFNYAGGTKPGFLRFGAVGLEENNCFEKNSPITVTLVIFSENYGNFPDYDLEFVDPVNISSLVYNKYDVEGHQCFDVAFYASPDKNGSVHVELIPSDGREHYLFGNCNIYTANSAEKIFISTASMETAMSLAGQKIIDRNDSYGGVFRHGTDGNNSGIVRMTGSVSYRDDAGILQPAGNIIVDIYKLTPGSELVEVKSVTVKDGAYALDLEVDMPEGNVIITVVRRAGLGGKPAELSEVLSSYQLSKISFTVTSGGSLEQHFDFGSVDRLDDAERA
jgi:hypothetical protein